MRKFLIALILLCYCYFLSMKTSSSPEKIEKLMFIWPTQVCVHNSLQLYIWLACLDFTFVKSVPSHILQFSLMKFYKVGVMWSQHCDHVTTLLPCAAEAMPGNIRRAQHFLGFMKRFIEYLKVSMLYIHYSGGVTSCHVTSVGYVCSTSLRRRRPTSSTSSSRPFALRGSPFVSARNDSNLSSPPSSWWTSATSPLSV